MSSTELHFLARSIASLKIVSLLIPSASILNSFFVPSATVLASETAPERFEILELNELISEVVSSVRFTSLLILLLMLRYECITITITVTVAVTVNITFNVTVTNS